MVYFKQQTKEVIYPILYILPKTEKQFVGGSYVDATFSPVIWRFPLAKSFFFFNNNNKWALYEKTKNYKIVKEHSINVNQHSLEIGSCTLAEMLQLHL